jgi:O-antigen/teichoic acid export membrane protein
MIVIAEPTFHLLFKEKWLPAVPYFQILTFAGMLSPFIYIFQELFIAKENSRYFLGIEVAKGTLLIVLIVLLFPRGITALAVSWIIYMVISLLISVVLTGKLIRYSLFHLMKDAGPYLLLAIASSAVSFLLTMKIGNNIIFILLNLVITGTSYILLCKLFKLEMLKEIEHWFEKKKKEKK